MKQQFLFLMISLAALSGMSSQDLGNSLVQNPASSDAQQSGVVLAKLAMPIYPALARGTLIKGDVNVLLGIAQDGKVESAVVTAGHPLLQRAALDSAQASQFECRRCTEATTSYSMVYTFALVTPECPAPTSIPANATREEGKTHVQVTQSRNRITVVDEGGICEGVFTRKVRSAKCLYLWKCGWHT